MGHLWTLHPIYVRKIKMVTSFLKKYHRELNEIPVKGGVGKNICRYYVKEL